MKPVFQSKICNKNGDCFSASIASILEVELNKVPKLDPEELLGTKVGNKWYSSRQTSIIQWLAERGYVILEIHNRNGEGLDNINFGLISVLETHCLCSVMSQAFPGCTHSIVGKFVKDEDGGVNIIQAHYPNPNNKPYENLYKNALFFEFLIKVK